MEPGLLLLLALVVVLPLCFYASQCAAAFQKLSWSKMEDLKRRGKDLLSLDDLRERIEELGPLIGAVRRTCEVALVLLTWTVVARFSGAWPLWTTLL